jgi:hypothetical protein
MRKVVVREEVAISHKSRHLLTTLRVYYHEQNESIKSARKFTTGKEFTKLKRKKWG